MGAKVPYEETVKIQARPHAFTNSIKQFVIKRRKEFNAGRPKEIQELIQEEELYFGVDYVISNNEGPLTHAKPLTEQGGHALLLELTRHNKWFPIKNRWFVTKDSPNTKKFLKYLNEPKRYAFKDSQPSSKHRRNQDLIAGIPDN